MARKRRSETVTLADHLRSIAAKGGKARWAQLTEEQKQELRSAGGEARAKNLSAAKRKKIAKKAADARWAKKNNTVRDSNT